MSQYAVTLNEDKQGLEIIHLSNKDKTFTKVLIINSWKEFLSRHQQYYLFKEEAEMETAVHRYIKFFYPEEFV